MNQEEISIELIYRIIKNNLLKILFLSFSLSFLFIGYSYTLQDLFESRAILKLSESDKVQSPSLAGLGGIASSVGIDFSGGSDYRISLAIARLQSRDFLSHLLKNKTVIANLVSSENLSDPDTVLIKTHSSYVQDILFVKEDRDSGFLRISITHSSPEFSKFFLELVVSELNKISRIKDLEETESALKYYNEQIKSKSIKDIRAAINNLIETQLQRQMLTNVREDYLLQYIDSPFLPIYKSKPRRSSYAITGFLLGLFLSAFFFIIRHKED